MNLFVLSLALGTAFGGERLDEKPWNLGSYLGFVESITLDKKVSVPGLNNNNDLYVEATTPDGERPWFFQISTSGSVISVSDEFVNSNNLKVQIKNQNLIPFPSDYSVGGQLKTVTIPTLQIGDMTLNNVQALVSSSKGKFDPNAKSMQIGLGSLDVAYNISPSTGTISFAPSAQGAELVKSTGTAIPYENIGWAQVQYGKKKKISPAMNLIIQSKISGNNTTMALEAGKKATSSISWDVLSSSPKKFIAGVHHAYGSIEVAGLKEDTWFAQSGAYHFSDYVHDATISRDVLYDYEISVSPADQTLSFKKSVSGTWQTLNSAKIPYLKTQTEPDEEGNEAEASDWEPLASAYYKDNMYEESLAAQKKVVELKPESCLSWHNQALTQYFLNDHDGALKSFQEASARYHKWWDIDLDTRLDIQKTQRSMETEEADAKKEQQKSLSLSDEPIWHYKQSSKCHIVDGWIASILLSQEKFDEVAKTYEKLDLDPRLAILQGNAALVQGNLDRAEAAYRQAIRLESAPSILARLGLALYFADQGEWRFADPLFAEAFALDSSDAVAGSLWFDNARANGEDTLAKALKLKETYPKSLAAHFLALREATILQNTETLAKLGSELLPIGPIPSHDNVSANARSLILFGKIEEAQKLLEAYPQFADTTSFYVAKADIAAYSGDSTLALDLLKKAAKKDPNNPVVALFLR